MDGQAVAPPVADVASNATNGTIPAEDAAGQTVAAIAQAEALDAGKTAFEYDVFHNPNANTKIDEIALYDRQVRLWGIEAQER